VHHLNPAKLNDAMARFGPTDAPPVGDRESMLDVLQGFIHELRAAGLPVSMTENLDAMRAVEHVDIAERGTFKAALGATLVKHHHLWRASRPSSTSTSRSTRRGSAGRRRRPDGPRVDGGDAPRPAAMGDVSPEELAQMLLQALMNMDREQMRQLAGMAVDRFAGMEPDGPSAAPTTSTERFGSWTSRD
jgi:hypothetical protein